MTSFDDQTPLLNAFTVDVEDYFQVTAFEGDISRADWPAFHTRVQRNTRRLLELLENHGVRGTFFVVGWIAERFPGLVCEIASAGHEIASHSYWHRLIYRLTPEQFRRDVRRSCDRLQELTGQAVTCYRAPCFSITRDSLWALEILVEEGIRIDSSVFPIHHDRYGIPDARIDIHPIETASGTLWEVPPAVVRYPGVNLPVSGGGYFRLYPIWLTNYWLGKINRSEGRPFVFYVHPWEIDKDQPRLRAGSRLSRWRHYVNLASTERKLTQLLHSFRFGTLTEVCQQATAPRGERSILSLSTEAVR